MGECWYRYYTCQKHSTDTATFRRKVSEHKQRLDVIIRLKSRRRRWQDLPKDLRAEQNLERFAAAIVDRLRCDNPTIRKA